MDGRDTHAAAQFGACQLIAHGPLVAALGEISLEDAAGGMVRYAYGDVWRFENDKMAALNAFVVAPD